MKAEYFRLAKVVAAIHVVLREGMHIKELIWFWCLRRHEQIILLATQCEQGFPLLQQERPAYHDKMNLVRFHRKYVAAVLHACDVIQPRS